MRLPWLALTALIISCGGSPSAPMPPAPPVEATAAEPGVKSQADGELIAPEPQQDDSDRVETDTLVLEGTPEVPDQLVLRLEQYSNVRSASLGDLSGDGTRMLITTRFGETSQVHLVEQPDGVRRQLTFAPEPSAGPKFVPGQDAIVFSRDVGGDEQHQILRMELGSGDTRRLTTADSRNGSYVFSRDGKQLAYMSNRRNKRDFDVWISDGRTAESARLAVEGKGYYYPIEFSRDGKKLLVGEYISVNESRVYLHTLGQRGLVQLTPKDEQAAYRLAKFGKTSDTVYLSSDRVGEFARLYEVTLAGGKAPEPGSWRVLTEKIPWNVTSAALSGDGRTLAFTANEGGVSRLYLMNTRSRRYRQVSALGQRQVGGMTWAKKSGELGLGLYSATMPGDAFVLGRRGRRLTRWTRSEMAGLDQEQLVEPELIDYESFDGKTIPAFVYKPKKGKKPYPVVVSIHGGPEAQVRPYFSRLTQYLVAESGIAVIMPNVRGSDGYGKTYVKLDNGFQREDSVKDIGALLDWIAKQPDLDASRVAVRGGSYGGYMVLASLVHYSDRLAAGIDVVGISSFVTFLENTADYRRDLRRAEYGDERDPEMRAHLEKISPLNNVEKIRAPLFVAQGANDPRVPASEAEQITAAVRKTGKDVWYFLAKNEGHGFRKKTNRDLFTQLSVLFLEKHLGVKR